MALFVVVVMFVALAAPDTQRPPGVIEQGLEQPGEVNTKVRFGALAIVVCAGRGRS